MPNYNQDLTVLAKIIDDCAREYIKENPDCEQNEKSENKITGLVMRAIKGQANPFTIMRMVGLHKQPFIDAGKCVQC